MGSWYFDVTLDRLYCADPESVHSNDKFALAGAVTTGETHVGFAMPTMHPPKHQYSYFPPELMHLFSGTAPAPRIGIMLYALDLDENDGWVDNRETIDKVATLIGDAVGAIPGIGIVGTVISGLTTIVPKIVDVFVALDEDDVLLDHASWVEMPPMTPHIPTTVPFSVQFSKSDPTGQSSFDYTLELTITCRWLPLFESSQPPVEPTEQPFQNSTLNSWVGSWEGRNVQADILVADTPVHVKPQDLRVTVVERVNGQPVTTVTERVSISRLIVELFQPVPTSDAGSGMVSGFSTSPHLVQVQNHGPKVTTRKVLMGGAVNPLVVAPTGPGAAVKPVKPVSSLQFQGDYLMLNNEASLEIYQLRHQGTVVGTALRYRRPSTMFLGVLGYGIDVMLYRKALTPH